MLSPEGDPIELPGEKFIYQNRRVAVKLQDLIEGNNVINSNNGKLYLSAMRLIYVPEDPVTFRVFGKGDREMKSVAIGITDMDGTGKIISPWFGPYKHRIRFRPKTDGGFEPFNYDWQVEFQFKEGGIVEFNDKMADLTELPVYTE